MCDEVNCSSATPERVRSDFASPEAFIFSVITHNFRRARQNELTPNQPKVRVKQIAITSLPAPAFPASYLAYSRTKAKPPITLKLRKTNPVTSSQRIPKTRKNEAAVTFTPRQIAPNVRFCPACLAATRATIPSLRAVDTFINGAF